MKQASRIMKSVPKNYPGLFVIPPAVMGEIQRGKLRQESMDPRFHGNDNLENRAEKFSSVQTALRYAPCSLRLFFAALRKMIFGTKRQFVSMIEKSVDFCTRICNIPNIFRWSCSH